MNAIRFVFQITQRKYLREMKSVFSVSLILDAFEEFERDPTQHL